MIHGIANVIEDIILPVQKLKAKWIGNIYTCLIAVLAFVFFRADTVTYGWQFVCTMFSNWKMDSQSMSILLEQLNIYNILTLVVAMVFAYPVFDRIKAKLQGKAEGEGGNGKGAAVLAAASIAALLLSILRLSSAAYNPFIYFRF